MAVMRIDRAYINDELHVHWCDIIYNGDGYGLTR